MALESNVQFISSLLVNTGEQRVFVQHLAPSAGREVCSSAHFKGNSDASEEKEISSLAFQVKI